MAKDPSARGMGSFLRFVAAGGLNTALTYAVYLLLLQWCSYQVSYAAAYFLGVIFAYVLNRVFVFRSHKGLISIVLLPLVYVAQFGVSISVLWLAIEKLSLPAILGPVVVIAVTLPLTFLLSRLAFIERVRS